MMEMVYKGNTKENGKKEQLALPKNIRQIGDPNKRKKIYLEDYAVTYLHQVQAAVLLGQVYQKGQDSYIFVCGAIGVSDRSFDGDIWEDIYQTVKERFEDSEVLGFALQTQEQMTLPTEEMNHIFKTYFNRENAVMLLHEPTEREDTLFVEENGTLKQHQGYYIYYDKNKSMQEYMVAQNEGKSVEKEVMITDKAIKNFRKIVAEKREKEHKGKEPLFTAKIPTSEATSSTPKTSRFLYAASTFLVLTILVIGVTMLNNYDKMRNMESTLSDLVNSSKRVAEVSNEQAKMDRESMTETLLETPQSAEKSTEPVVQNSEQQETTAPPEAAETEARAASAPVQRVEQASYIVKDGDTLAEICRMYYGNADRLEEICAFNGIENPNHILLGQKILLP